LYTFLKNFCFKIKKLKKNIFIYIHKIKKEQDMAAYTAAKSVYICLTEPLAIYLGVAGRQAARKKVIDAIGEENVFQNVGKIIPKFDSKGRVLFFF